MSGDVCFACLHHTKCSNEAHRDRDMWSIFPLLWYQRNLILLFLRYKTLCKTRKNTREFHFYYWDHVSKVNEWCLVDWFIMLRDYCIAKCKTFSACGGLLMALLAIFFSQFKIFTLTRTLISINIPRVSCYIGKNSSDWIKSTDMWLLQVSNFWKGKTWWNSVK